MTLPNNLRRASDADLVNRLYDLTHTPELIDDEHLLIFELERIADELYRRHVVMPTMLCNCSKRFAEFDELAAP